MKACVPRSIPLAHVTSGRGSRQAGEARATSRVAWAGVATQDGVAPRERIEVGGRANGGGEPDARQLVAPARRLQFGHRPRVAPP